MKLKLITISEDNEVILEREYSVTDISDDILFDNVSNIIADSEAYVCPECGYQNSPGESLHSNGDDEVNCPDAFHIQEEEYDDQSL